MFHDGIKSETQKKRYVYGYDQGSTFRKSMIYRILQYVKSMIKCNKYIQVIVWSIKL